MHIIIVLILEINNLCSTIDHSPENIIYNATITAYNDTVEQTGNHHNLTYSGKPVKTGFIAASPDIIKKWGLGSTVYIEDIGIFKLEDKTSNRYKKRIDIYFKHYDRAIEFGKKKNVKIIKIE